MQSVKGPLHVTLYRDYTRLTTSKVEPETAEAKMFILSYLLDKGMLKEKRKNIWDLAIQVFNLSRSRV